ncbi:MAG: hypothetical protein OHK0017_00150 [Patescibacteria group bacterium]
MSKLKVLILTWEIYPLYSGGLGYLVRHVVNELRNQQIEVTVVLPQIPNGMEIPDVVNLQRETRRYLRDKVKVPGLKFDLEFFQKEGGQGTKSWPKLFSAKQKKSKSYNLYPNNMPLMTQAWAMAVGDYVQQNQDFDIVIGMDWHTIPAFYRLKDLRPNLPFIFYVNASEFDRFPEGKLSSTSKSIASLEKLYYPQADGIVAISEVSKESLVTMSDVPEEKIEVVYDDLDFKPDKEGIKALTKGKNVLFVGRVENQKGLPFLIDTADRIRQIDSQVKFIIAGDGNNMPSVIDSIAERELERNVLIIGWVNDQEKKMLYSSSDLFVMPSPIEPFGLTPLEAIRSDLPVIASKKSGFVGVVPSTPTFDYYDTNHFVEMILYYLNNPEESAKLLKQQKLELADHSWVKQVESLVQFMVKLRNSN